MNTGILENMSEEVPAYGAVGKISARIGGNSSNLTVAIMIANTCTISAVALPAVMASMGWAAGTMVTILCAAMNCHTCMLVWRMFMCFPEQKNYGELIEKAFELAPPMQRSGAKALCDFSTYGFIFVGTSYNLVCLAQALGWMFNDWRLCLPMLMLGGTLANIFLQCGIRSLGSSPVLLFANMAAVLVMVLVPLALFANMGSSASRAPGSRFVAVEAGQFATQFQGYGALVYMLTTQYITPELLSEMQDPSEYPKVACQKVLPLQVAFALLAGLGGYYYLGSEGTEIVPDYLPFGGLLQLTAMCFMFGGIVNNLVNGVVICGKMQQWWDLPPDDSESDDTASRRGTITWIGTVSTMFLLAWLIANVVPSIKDFTSLLGASFAPLCCFLVPILAYARLYHDFGEDRLPRISAMEWMAIAFWLLLSLLLMTYGTYQAMRSIQASWATRGYPFDCNCHMLWNTCDCSASRPGMEQCSSGINGALPKA